MDTNSILMSIQDKLPKDGMAVVNLREKLEKMSETERKNFSDKLLAIKLKNPNTGIICAMLYVDRFYLGSIGLGILIFALKFITCMFGIGIIWWIIDIVNIGKKVRQYNYQQILQIL